ncbi:Protein CBG15628 [Caenorhabditis briggsae]|uniref:Brain protein I3 n=2 Tax=Caenorhabditis briggsae TaxID=6238 RepID=A0AAE9ADN0_CAEBR|nr:Protein CBG15628 [Caenorhabditis briggsae]ULT97558.1 hypothetical protein L3Y34_005405 [Caenorhabditis briggsae]UMM30730.1 hypothetical protein L5515_012491 [Caenorhabditis briggsae]CAP33825.1 Protein CBG15628 [Caenorhabditis briggsae]
MSTTSSTTTCPACHEKRVKSRFSWRAILWAIFCFPCGFYCCLRRKTYYCTHCQCDVVKRTETRQIMPRGSMNHGYNYRLYEATKTGLPPDFAAAYRNPALSTVSSTGSEQSTTLSTAPIIP